MPVTMIDVRAQIAPPRLVAGCAVLVAADCEKRGKWCATTQEAAVKESLRGGPGWDGREVVVRERTDGSVVKDTTVSYKITTVRFQLLP